MVPIRREYELVSKFDLPEEYEVEDTTDMVDPLQKPGKYFVRSFPTFWLFLYYSWLMLYKINSSYLYNNVIYFQDLIIHSQVTNVSQVYRYK